MKSKLYFPGLNGVRFIAALLVVVDHTEELKGHFGTRALWSDEYSAHLGSVGVTVFFALSGYLITYLLLVERSVSGTLDIKHFYLRRVLRIWPIYYLLTVLSFFVFPHIAVLQIPHYSQDVQVDFIAKLAMFVFLLPNVAFIVLETVPFANVLWSVGVEEQFYLFWPWLVKSARYPVVVALGVFLVIKAAALVMPDKTLALIFARTRFSCMLIGAGGAYVYFFRKHLIERYVFASAAQILAWVALLFLIFWKPRFPYPASVLQHELIAALAALLILNIAHNGHTIVRLENRVTDHLGKLSYGIYVYHLIGVVCAIRFLRGVYVDHGGGFIAWSMAVSLLALGISVALAQISYRYIEAHFLRQKLKFSVLVSGDLAHGQSDLASATHDEKTQQSRAC
jgi:peptidoglycan/LPS O-acetylase OafA/YrhL